MAGLFAVSHGVADQGVQPPPAASAEKVQPTQPTVAATTPGPLVLTLLEPVNLPLQQPEVILSPGERLEAVRARVLVGVGGGQDGGRWSPVIAASIVEPGRAQGLEYIVGVAAPAVADWKPVR